jgi:hypothetical protein
VSRQSHRRLWALALWGCLAAPGAALAADASPAAAPTPSLPTIYHSVTRALCSALGGKIAPAIGMMIQNDQAIAKSPAFFQQYIDRAKAGSDDGQNIAVLRLESLVSPLVNNTLAIQKLLENPDVFPDNPKSDDGKRLTEIKTEMLKALATQQAAIDIINGFVDTQQLGQMQHDGFGYLGSSGATGPGGQSSQALTQAIGATPDPEHPQLFDNLALQAGITPNSYEIDPSKIPGLALGYNSIARLKDGVVWTQEQSKADEVPLSDTIIQTSRLCGAQLPATPSPKP